MKSLKAQLAVAAGDDERHKKTNGFLSVRAPTRAIQRHVMSPVVFLLLFNRMDY